MLLDRPEPWHYAVLDGNEKAFAILQLKRELWHTPTENRPKREALARRIYHQEEELKRELATCAQ